MKNKIYKLTESDLHQIIEKTVYQMINERVIGQGESFTPYKEGEGEKMRKASLNRSAEDRNPAYAKALKAAQERKAKKSSMEEEINEIGDTAVGQERLGAVAGRRYNRYNQDQNKIGIQNSYKKNYGIVNDASQEAQQNGYNEDAYNKGFNYGMKQQ